MSGTWLIDEADLPALDFVASALALVVRPGDLLALQGELGAGKTTFARALIRQVRGVPGEEVPSPTFALCQSYRTARMAISHFDCYRLADASEIEELGLSEALAEGLVLVEWPERIAGHLPADRLEVALAESEHDDLRRLALSGYGTWAERLERLRAMVGFLDREGWGAARLGHLQGDASTRAYAHVRKQDRACILMDWPRHPDGPPIRDGLSYSAIAHLAEDVRPFIAVAQALRALGVSAPEILGHDTHRGFLLIEDLGDRVFGDEAAAGGDLGELYRSAVDVLLALRRSGPPQTLALPDGGSYALPAYDGGTLMIEVELLLDWFWPAVHGADAPAPVRAEFRRLWRLQFEHLARQPAGWVLRDYHSPNLIWLPERDGIARVGVIDFQDALVGHLAYDLVSLLQDARLDVPAALERELFAHYCAAGERIDSTFDSSEISRAYAVLGAQRNTKILGIFVRLAKRDGKRGYLAHLPRIAAYLERNLGHPDLAALRAWYDRHLPPETRRGPPGV